MDLRAALLRHAPADERESAHLGRIVRFVSAEGDPFDRRNPRAHLTGSAFVVSHDGLRVLLLHHRKLGRWLQPGGHADAGESSGEAVALREARVTRWFSWPELTSLDLDPGLVRGLDKARVYGR